VTAGLTGAFGGGAELDADPTDGVIDGVVIEARSRARLALHAYGMRAGELERQRGALPFSGRACELATDGATGFNVDGELIETAALRLTARRRAFELVIG
jgi:diacylglycerol kinase family enzyme